ncbi:MAG: phosphoglycerate kinase [Planctomycetes bacterium]|nr:phosphoglycerate kinase [Planctomycetota bacterium]
MNKRKIEDLDLKGKRVLTRVDYNVPLNEKLEVTDDLRIRSSLATVNHILEHRGTPVLMSHLGRPKGKVVDSMRLAPVAAKLEELTGVPVKMMKETVGTEVKAGLPKAGERKIVLLENLRFNEGETTNDPVFSKALSELGDVYVNDAFGTAHRAHASVVGVPGHFAKDRAGVGFLMAKELDYFRKVLENPDKPMAAILGGAKVSDKLPVVKNLFGLVDQVLIGGGMAYTFLKVIGCRVGASKVEEESLDAARETLTEAKKRGVEILLPVDHVVADAFKEDAKHQVVDADIPDGWMGLDIGPATVSFFINALRRAKTVLWNGPLGVFEWEAFSSGTRLVAEFVARREIVSVVGGGDSAAAAKRFGLEDQFSHISTGGGASLELLEGKVLPGIDALPDA